MTTVLTSWLMLTAALGLAATLAAWSKTNRYRTAAVIAFLAAAGTSYGLVQLPLGNPIEGTPPPGRYAILGARIDVDVAIYVLLDRDGEPVYYRLPYSTSDANGLQHAIDSTCGNGNAQGEFGNGGAVEFYAAPVQGAEEKVPEAPMIGW